MEIFKTGEMNIVKNSLGIAESIFNEDKVQNDPLRSFLTSFLSLNCNCECSALLQARIQDFIFSQAKNGLIDLPNITHKFHVKAGTETHLPGQHSTALVRKTFFMLFPLLQSLNIFLLLQQNRPEFNVQEPPLLPTSDSYHQDVLPDILFKGLQVEKYICDKLVNYKLYLTRNLGNTRKERTMVPDALRAWR